MERFLSVLTGVLFGLFLAYFVEVLRRNSCQQAGKLLCRVRLRRLNYRLIFFWGIAAVVLLLDIFFILPKEMSDEWSGSIVLSSNIFTAVIFLNFGYQGSRDLEFWEHGCLFPLAGPLVPWHKIRYCRWKDSNGTLSIAGRFGQLTLRLAPSEIEKVNEVLFSCVKLRDVHGDVMNPELEEVYGNSASEKTNTFRLQFNIKTILFLMVAVASAASLVGVHLRAGWHDEQLLKKLEAYQPVVGYRGNRVDVLNFSKSTKKPSDEDLRYVAGFSRLNNLNLNGCPITDEGLAYLTNLKHLQWLDISNTKVADAGLVHLAKIKSLRHITALSYLLPGQTQPSNVISGARFSQKALLDFHKAMPDTKISH